MSDASTAERLPFEDPPWDALAAECERLLEIGRARGYCRDGIVALETVLGEIHEQQAIAAATYGA